jgi:hypothetical protein
MGAMHKPFVAAFLGLVLAAACSEDGGNGSGAAGSAGQKLWGTSDCGLCVKDRCASQWPACYGDPGCAAHLDCLRACPVASGGDVDLACAASCPIADSTASKHAIDALRYCRELGDAARACTACGKGEICAPELAPTCNPSSETNACWKCEDENCCVTQLRCRDNQACLDVLACLQSCTGDQCFENCYAEHPAGAEDFGAKLGCAANNCFDECSGQTDACSTCLAGNCKCENYACSTNSECRILIECKAECGSDPACWDQCEAAHPAGLKSHQAVLLCGAALCEQECG